jgi:hypothetical protein
MLDGLAVNELIVGLVAARSTPVRATQANNVSRMKKDLPQYSATTLRSIASNCLFIPPEIFIFHPWIRL